MSGERVEQRYIRHISAYLLRSVWKTTLFIPEVAAPVVNYLCAIQILKPETSNVPALFNAQGISTYLF